MEQRTRRSVPPLRAIAAGAATLTERCSGPYRPRPGGHGGSLARLCEVLAGADESRLGHVLGRHGIPLESARTLAAGVALAPDSDLPGWIGSFADSFGWAWEGRVPVATTASSVPEGLPFAELIVPAVQCAVAGLQRRAGLPMRHLEPRAEEMAAGALAKRLARLLAPALALEFEAWRAAREPAWVRAINRAQGKQGSSLHQTFVEEMNGGGLGRFFEEYVVLARLAGTLVNHWISSTAELLERLDRDRDLLAGRLETGDGRVTELRIGLSDPHEGGRTVCALRFAGGPTVVYKPRDVTPEAAWTELLSRLRSWHGAPSLEGLQVLERGGYGWLGAVRQAPCGSREAAERYFRHVGELLALVHALGGHDFHRGNLVAAGEDPVLVDLETLLGPGPRTSATARGRALARISDSVCGTGLIPHWSVGPEGQCADVSALGAFEDQETFRSGWDWEGVGTDELAPRRGQRQFTPRGSLPDLGGEPAQSTEYLEPLLSGFEASYRFLLAHRQDLVDPRGPLALLEDCPIRVLFRPTWHYMMVSPAQLPAECFRDGVLWEAAILSLNRNLSDDSELWSVLPAERRSMIQLDVPLFRTRSGSTDVESGSAERLQGLLPESPLDRARRRIEQLDDADLSLQLGLIRAAFHTRVGDANHDEPAAEGSARLGTAAEDTPSTSTVPIPQAAGVSSAAPGEQLVERARSIGEVLIARAIRGTTAP